MNRRVVWAIARKDISAVRDNIQVWLPMIIVPLVIGVVLPGILVGALTYGGVQASGNLENLLSWLEELPPSPLSEALEALPLLEQQLAYLAANYLLAPLFLLIPLMTASVISADSFAGEKERGTLESLLFSPVDLPSLFLGKVTAALLPATGISLLTLALAALTVNAVAWPLFGAPFFPGRNWLPLMLLVMPAVSLLAVLINVFISARVRTFQAAFQLGGLIVLPVIGVTVAQAGGVLLLNQRTATLLGVAVLLMDVLLLRRFRAFLDRPRLFEGQVR